MAERVLSTEKILPCFLDRLTDHYPRARRESREHRVVTLRQYRASVLRDMELLLNTISPPHLAFEVFGHVRNSVLNYGIRSLSGVWASGRSGEAIVARIRQAILDFEPRILRDSLTVNLPARDELTGSTVMNIEISGELWVEPVPERLYIKTEIDLETGTFRVV